MFGYTGNKQLITVLSYITGNRLRISLPYVDSRRVSLAITPIEQTKELYVSGFGLKRLDSDKEWFEEWFEVKEASVDCYAGCIEETTEEEVDSLLSTFHGVKIGTVASSICIRLSHQISSTLLTVKKEGEVILEEELDTTRALYPGRDGLDG